MELGLGLAERDHDVTLVCHPSSAVGRQLEGLPQLNLVTIAIRAELNPYRVLQLSLLNRRTRPDVVLADKRKDVKLSAAARWFGGSFPLVHRHGAPSPLKDSPIYRHFWTREVQALIVNSWTMKKRMLARTSWLEGVPIHVIPNGKDHTRYRSMPEARSRVRAELGIPEKAFVVSFHGMVSPRKNVDLLVKTVAELPRELEVTALIVGLGPTLPQVRDLSASLGAPVVFAGLRTDIPEVLSAADVSAHPSTAEGFSNSVVESLACGLPVIASDATSHPEQVEDGVQGVLVPPGRPEALAAAIRWLAENPASRDRMARAARRRAMEEFGLEGMIDRYDAALRETVEAFRKR